MQRRGQDQRCGGKATRCRDVAGGGNWVWAEGTLAAQAWMPAASAPPAFLHFPPYPLWLFQGTGRRSILSELLF